MALLRSRPRSRSVRIARSVRGAGILGPALVAVFACSSAPHAPTPPAAARTPAPEVSDTPKPAPRDKASPDQAFEVFAQSFLDGYLQRSPVDATQAGEHRFDGTWPDVSAGGRGRASATWLADTRAALAELPRDGLSEQNQIDAAILDDQLRFGLFALDELKPRDTRSGRRTPT